MPRYLSHHCLYFTIGIALIVGCAPSDTTAIADAKKGDAKKKHKHKANRLAKESSPYLLLHAHNPVDWYPWGPEALAKAKKENKPIFLSIGYSSCYWCHVMERKVFMNEEIAKFMNKHFINIKVDREERPDIDDIYMTSLTIYFQLVGSGQGGGWPLSMFLTPEGKPFAGGTYFPPKTVGRRLGFNTILQRVQNLWAKREKSIRSDADRLTNIVKRTMKPRPVLRAVKIEQKLVDEVAAALQETYDDKHGGIGFRASNPNKAKFPVPAKLALLQHAAIIQNDKKAASILDHTLDAIAAGGIHDHLGGGFHRYSTDRRWHVPHFEKMLYDQAQLAEVYVNAYKRTGKPIYKEAAAGIFLFVLREMTDPKGGFYSALDAETDGVEGEYYVWKKKEVEKILGKDAALFKTVYGMEKPNDFEHGYVLHLPNTVTEIAKTEKIPLAELKTRLSTMRAKLLSARSKRKPLLRDDKVLTSWNGLMIRAFANAGRILKEKKYLQVAEKAAMFVLQNMRDDKNRLRRTWRNGQAKLNAYVDDYAFFVSGLLALHEATDDEKWLNAARNLTDMQIRDYWSKVGGGFFFTPHYHEELIARTRNAYDAVLPSGNAVAVRNLVALTRRTGVKKYRKLATETIRAFADNLDRAPTGTAHLALAIAEYLDAGPEKKKTEKKTAAGTIVPISGTQKSKLKGTVSAKAYLSVDKLPVGGKCRIVMLLTIEPGWHINTNPPKPKSMIPTVFSIRSKAGIKLTNVEYPKGKDFTLPGFDEKLTVYEKKVAIFGTLEIPKTNKDGLKADEMELRINYQSCNDTRCLPPKTIKLKGKIPLAAAGETVRQVNAKLFKTPGKKKK